jgi:outer membrane protein assembly factor BamB
MSAPTDKSQGSPWPLIAMLVIAVLLVGGYFAYPYVNEYLESRPDSGDYHANQELIAKLGSSKLANDPPAAASTGWPQWRGPNRDGVSPEKGLLTQWSANGPDIVWKAKTGDGYASPAIADGRCILTVQDGTDEAIVCWDAETGSERWRRKYPARFENRESGVGPHGTASIVGDRAYVVGATGMFHCLAVEDGKVLWSHDLLKEFNVKNQEYGVSFSTLIEGDMVITMPGGAGGNSLAAFNRQDGQMIWKSLDDRAGYSSPVAGTIAGKRQLVFLTAENILGISPTDGKMLWKHPWPLFKDCNIATPTIIGDYVFVSSGYGKGCILLEVSADASGAMQVRPVYEHNRMRSRFSTTVLVNEHLYGFDETWLVCMELRTGKIRWKKRGFDEGQLLAADGQLFVLGEHGKLALVEANPEKYVERGSCQLLGGRCWTMPVLANGKLYVRDQEQILCLKVK